MKRPLAMNRVDRELRNQFKVLIEALKVVNTDREEITYEALNRRILQEVTEKPILARMITSRAGVGAGESLLLVACSKLILDTSHDVIKCLIQTYPRALITYSDNGTPIYMIAGHPIHCTLLPWIATNYTWILDHEVDKDRTEYPFFAFLLLEQYIKRRRTRCTATTVINFFEAYPRALNQQDRLGFSVLHKVLKPKTSISERECEVDLFKWMAERCPSSHLLDIRNPEGSTPLHLACKELAKHEGNDSSEICKYLIDKCPEAVGVRQTMGVNRPASFRLRTNTIQTYQYLPIHYLLEECDYRVVREVLVCLLKEYPDSIDIARPHPGQRLPPSSIPFIQSIKPYLDEEKELKETIASLTVSNSSLTKAVACTNNKLMRSTCNVFDSWATSFINTTEVKINSTSVKLQDMCNEGDEYIR